MCRVIRCSVFFEVIGRWYQDQEDGLDDLVVVAPLNWMVPLWPRPRRPLLPDQRETSARPTPPPPPASRLSLSCSLLQNDMQAGVGSINLPTALRPRRTCEAHSSRLDQLEPRASSPFQGNDDSQRRDEHDDHYTRVLQCKTSMREMRTRRDDYYP